VEQQFGCRLFVKVETLDPVRSFKGRGTEYLAAPLDWRPHPVCATAGNFGQGMAHSARKRGLALTIFASVNANPVKLCHRSLSRRSQNGRVLWDRMRRLIARWLPLPTVCHPYPLRRMDVIT
jgi:hypothetical protein